MLSRFAITNPKSCQDIPNSPWDYGMSSGLPCPTRYITVPLSFPSQSPLGTVGCSQDTCVPLDNHKLPLGLWEMSSGLPFPTRYNMVPLSFPSELGWWDVFRTLVSHGCNVLVPILVLSQDGQSIMGHWGGMVWFVHPSTIPGKSEYLVMAMYSTTYILC